MESNNHNTAGGALAKLIKAARSLESLAGTARRLTSVEEGHGTVYENLVRASKRLEEVLFNLESVAEADNPVRTCPAKARKVLSGIEAALADEALRSSIGEANVKMLEDALFEADMTEAAFLDAVEVLDGKQ